MRKYYNLLNDIWKMIKATHPESTGEECNWDAIVKQTDDVVKNNPDCDSLAQKFALAYMDYLEELK